MRARLGGQARSGLSSMRNAQWMSFCGIIGGSLGGVRWHLQRCTWANMLLMNQTQLQICVTDIYSRSILHAGQGAWYMVLLRPHVLL